MDERAVVAEAEMIISDWQQLRIESDRILLERLKAEPYYQELLKERVLQILRERDAAT